MIGIGIDVSKGKSMIAGLNELGELVLTPREVQHRLSELESFAVSIKALKQEVCIVLESTSHYHYPVVDVLSQAGLNVHVLNPFLIKKFMDLDIRKGKTDKKDALRIAQFACERGRYLSKAYEADPRYGELKFLSRQYSQLVSMRIKAKVQLNHLLDEIMPGIKTVFTGNPSNPNQILYDFIEKFEHFELIRKKSEAAFLKQFSLWAEKRGYYRGTLKAYAIYKMAQDSILTRPANSSTRLAVEQCLKVLKETESSSNCILAQMIEIAKALPEYSTVHLMKGVGDKTAPRLIAEIGDVRRFTSAKALNAYAGNDAPPYESGQFEGKRRHISKRGSASLRKVGYEVMMALKVTKPSVDNAVYLFMIKKESEGKPLAVAKMAALNKFFRIYYTRVTAIY
jgi:transposase